MKKKILALILCLAMCFSMMLQLTACKKDKDGDDSNDSSNNNNNNGNNGGGSKPDAFVIMTDALDGVFNPFFSTTAADATIVAMTQIGMLTTGLDDKGNVIPAYGDKEAVAVKDMIITKGDDTTTYTFVIKNGLKYADGHPLTIEDVLFNLYVYLDPVYTGSSTIYSTDILGLADYRSQQLGADSDLDDEIMETARDSANKRINELINLFRNSDESASGDTSYIVSYETMKEAIQNHTLSDGYKEAISANPGSVTNAQLLADYELALKLFKEELGRDYIAAQEAYDLTKAPYKDHAEFQNEIFRFMCYEGKVKIEYAKDDNGKDIKTQIIDIDYEFDHITTKEQAIDYVYKATYESSLDVILKYWATANELMTKYTADAKQVYLDKLITSGECQNCSTPFEKGTKFCSSCGHSTLLVPSISGIKSLGHNSDRTSVTIGENTYTIAHEHDANGAPANANEYDVLEVTINGVDPKAIWNFAFAVAPQHYYAEGYDVDIAKNNFGVDYSSTSYMTNVIQSLRNVKLPMGAGAYKVTDRNHTDTPDIGGFFKDNIVYFKANRNFMFDVKIDKVRYQVVSASNALDALATGQVHYITPQLTDNNLETLDGLKSKGMDYLYTDQLGYGYIGINAGKIPDIELRKAIMVAMDTSLALSYYRTGTASQIYWPMSKVSWAYPTDQQGNYIKDNEHDYPALLFNEEDAKAQIQELMELAGVSAGNTKLKLKFTIAGSDLTDHPTYLTFQNAADILNSCGWDVEVIADSQALTKLSTGSLAVWAAAWGSTVDPDMYQVYHKNSTATSVKAWGYTEILANSDGNYDEENDILNSLSDVIDAARETEDRDERRDLYKEAMGYILDLAIELPVYQRSVLYAYNASVIDKNSIPTEINEYTSPIDKIWEIEFAK